MPRGRIARPPVVRFWEQVEKSEDCWEWLGAKDKDGYGQFTDGQGRNGRAHRFSWAVHNGEIPAGIRVLHKCDNPACVRPSHLFLGTDADNLADARSKGRLKVKGVDNPAAKLTEVQVRKVRILRKKGWTQQRIASLYGVCPYTIAAILNGTNWKHVK